MGSPHMQGFQRRSAIFFHLLKVDVITQLVRRTGGTPAFLPVRGCFLRLLRRLLLHLFLHSAELAPDLAGRSGNRKDEVEYQSVYKPGHQSEQDKTEYHEFVNVQTPNMQAVLMFPEQAGKRIGGSQDG